jgi:hypothetical protein
MGLDLRDPAVKVGHRMAVGRQCDVDAAQAVESVQRVDESLHRVVDHA